MTHILVASSLVLLSTISSSSAAALPQATSEPAALQSIAWTSCGIDLQCGSLKVPLDYTGGLAGEATIPLVKYAAKGDRRGSILINPGGPGASGVTFVKAGAAAFSNITGGAYDIIGWDTRGNNGARPLLACFPNAGAEYDFAAALPSAPNVWSGEFTDPKYNANITDTVTAFDTAVGALAEACVKQNSPALYTSSTSSVIQDMAAIVDAVDGNGAKLNYWGFSYGTVYLAEFIQAFPERVGRVIADGVVDPDITIPLGADAASVGASLDDLSALCEQAGLDGCAFAAAPAGNTKSVRQRIDDIFQDVFLHPIVSSGVTIDISVVAAFLDTFQVVPVTWKVIFAALKGLEARDPSTLLSILGAIQSQPPADRLAPDTASLAGGILALLDRGPSASKSTIGDIIASLRTLFIDQNDPIAGSTVSRTSLTRHFPAGRPASVTRNGTAKMPAADAVLQKCHTKVLIISSENDPATPIAQAKKLRALLPNSSVLASREGPGHTTVSVASLGMAKIINSFFSSPGAPTLPADKTLVPVDQVLFPPNVNPNGLVTPAIYIGKYDAQEQTLLDAVYGIDSAFLASA